MADAASSPNGSAPASTALEDKTAQADLPAQMTSLSISSTTNPVPQSGSHLIGDEAGTPHARAGTTHALEVDVHVDRMREPVEGPTISMGQKVRDIKTSIVRQLQKLVPIVGPTHDIALRALWLPGDVPELNEEAEEVQIGRRKYSAVRLEVCAAPRNKW